MLSAGRKLFLIQFSKGGSQFPENERGFKGGFPLARPRMRSYSGRLAAADVDTGRLFLIWDSLSEGSSILTMMWFILRQP